MSLVFVSYSRKDSDYVVKLVKELRERGLTIWLDQDSIAAGERWDVAIEKALDEASHILIVLSPDSVASQNVLDEIDLAIEEGKTIVPIMISRCKLPLRIRRMQYTEFLSLSEYDAALEKLLVHLSRKNEAGDLDAIAVADYTRTMTAVAVAVPEPQAVETPNMQKRFATKIQRTDFASLVVVAGELTHQHWILKNEHTVIGRNETCDIVLAFPQISREHVTITRQDNRYFVTDQRSYNGTWLNSLRLESGQNYELTDGDEINLAWFIILRFDATIDKVNAATTPIDPSTFKR
jgi:hypothetical protein